MDGFLPMVFKVFKRRESIHTPLPSPPPEGEGGVRPWRRCPFACPGMMLPMVRRVWCCLLLLPFLLVGGCHREKDGSITELRVDRSAKHAKCKAAMMVLLTQMSGMGGGLPGEGDAMTEDGVRALPGFAAVQGECGEPMVEKNGSEVVVEAHLFAGSEAACSMSVTSGGVQEDGCSTANWQDSR